MDLAVSVWLAVSATRLDKTLIGEVERMRGHQCGGGEPGTAVALSQHHNRTKSLKFQKLEKKLACSCREYTVESVVSINIMVTNSNQKYNYIFLST